MSRENNEHNNMIYKLRRKLKTTEYADSPVWQGIFYNFLDNNPKISFTISLGEYRPRIILAKTDVILCVKIIETYLPEELKIYFFPGCLETHQPVCYEQFLGIAVHAKINIVEKFLKPIFTKAYIQLYLELLPLMESFGWNTKTYNSVMNIWTHKISLETRRKLTGIVSNNVDIYSLLIGLMAMHETENITEAKDLLRKMYSKVKVINSKQTIIANTLNSTLPINKFLHKNYNNNNNNNNGYNANNDNNEN